MGSFRRPPMLLSVFIIAVIIGLIRMAVEWQTLGINTEHHRDDDNDDAPHVVSLPKRLPNDPPFSNSLACRLETQERLVPLINNWFYEDVPLLMNVFKIGNKYHLLFVSFHLQHWKDWHQATWYCNNGNGNHRPATISSRMRKESHGQLTMTCETPILESILVHQNSTITGRPPTYDLQPYLKCDAVLANETVDDRIIIGAAPTTTRIAACTAIRDDWPREITFEWIEYHRLLGIEHFFVYVNDAWNLTSLLPKRSYVTYIPYDFHLNNHREYVRKKKIKWYNFFQQAHMHDCVYMTRRMEFDWVAMTDVDEYLFLADANNNSNATLQTAILDGYYQDRHASMGALQFNSFSFGGPTKNVEQFRNKTAYPLVMDYVHRSKHDNLEKAPRFRPKFLINPKNVHDFNVHYILEGKEVNVVNASKARIQHYKHPWTGPHRSGKPNNWIEDTTMRDRYRETLLELIK